MNQFTDQTYAEVRHGVARYTAVAKPTFQQWRRLNYEVTRFNDEGFEIGGRLAWGVVVGRPQLMTLQPHSFGMLRSSVDRPYPVS